MREPIIAFDLNGVLADANTPLLRIVRAVHGLNISPHDLTTYETLRERLRDYLDDARAAAQWLTRQVNDPAFILSLQPFPDARAAWAQLDGFERRIVSGHQQNDETIAATRRWLDAYGFHGRCDCTAYKDGWCQQTRAAYFVEDAPKHALAIATTPTRVLLRDRPYNRSLDDERITRVATLLDIPAVIGEDRGYDQEVLPGDRAPGHPSRTRNLGRDPGRRRQRGDDRR